jgi:hypothetical protein
MYFLGLRVGRESGPGAKCYGLQPASFEGAGGEATRVVSYYHPAARWLKPIGAIAALPSRAPCERDHASSSIKSLTCRPALQRRGFFFAKRATPEDQSTAVPRRAIVWMSQWDPGPSGLAASEFALPRRHRPVLRALPRLESAGLFLRRGATLASLRHFRKTMMSLLFWLAVSLGVLSILAGAAALVKDWLS